MIYLDNAATTYMYEELDNILSYYNKERFFNPSAKYHEAIEVAKDIKNARQKLASFINCNPDEITYVSSGTEGNNLALLGCLRKKNSRIIVSATEHASVYNVALNLKNKGYDVVFCPVNEYGTVDPDSLKQLVNDNTELISIAHVNNETGGINDIKQLVKTAKSINNKVIFHSDGVQAFGKIDVNVKESDVDAYTLAGHKIHAPKGIAALYHKSNISINPIISGGGQENGLRSATENVSGIMALSKAAEIILSKLDENARKFNSFKSMITDSLKVFDIKINSGIYSAPHILNLSIKGVKGEVLLHLLETYHILISTGSACSTKKGISRIPAAIGLNKDYAEGTIRISFGEQNTLDDIKEFINIAKKCINELLPYGRK